jgi:hypothetical protein
MAEEVLGAIKGKGGIAMTASTVEDELSSPAHLVTDSDEPHKGDLLEQFYLTLSVMYLGAPRPDRSAVHDRIERLFQSRHSWRNAYEIEQLLCFVLTEPQIASELDRRLAEAKTLKIDYVDVIHKELQDTSKSVDKRIVLHRLLNDLQWFYAKRVHYRSAGKRLMLRASLLFMMALVTLFLVLFIQFFAHRSIASTIAQASAPNPAAVVNRAATGNPATANPPAPSELQKPGGDK